MCYDKNEVSKVVNNEKFDLILVDGPSGGLGKAARKPALPSIINNINVCFCIFLDDVRRINENLILNEWFLLLKEAKFDVKKINPKNKIYGILTSGKSFSSNPINH